MALVARSTFWGIGVAAFDDAGNCGIPFTATTATSPVDKSATAVIVFNNVSHSTSYDPYTSTGDKSDTNSVGGQCLGASFDSTGATVTGTSVERIAVSNHGKRMDSVATSLGSDPMIGGFSLSVTLLRQ